MCCTNRFSSTSCSLRSSCPSWFLLRDTAMLTLDRRDFLRTAAAVALPVWQSSRLLSAQQPAVTSRRLTDSLSVLDVGGSNVLCSSANPQGLVRVDSGAAQSASQRAAAVRAIRADAKVQAVF